MADWHINPPADPPPGFRVGNITRTIEIHGDGWHLHVELDARDQAALDHAEQALMAFAQLGGQ